MIPDNAFLHLCANLNQPMNFDKATLNTLFGKPFDPSCWTGFLAEFFGVRHDPEAQLFKTPRRLEASTAEEDGFLLGSFTTSDGYLVGLFRYDITAHSVLRRKVGLRNLVRRYLGTDFDAALVVFSDTDSPAWRFSFICDIKGEATAPRRFTYVFGDPATPHRTPVERFLALQSSRDAAKPVSFEAMQEAFSVEALSDQFFREYKEHYETFVSHVTGKRFVRQSGKWVETEVGRPHRTLYAVFGRDDKRVRDYVKKLLGRLVFLHFLQKKGWLGASSGTWADGDRAFLLHLFEKASPEQKDDFLDGVLEKLFFGALNTDRTASGDFFITGVRGIGKCRIPYLNGGLFERDELDALRVKFPAEFFERLLCFFAQYNFTIDENDPDEAEVGIDPEMLGRIFENLLEDNKDKGAFYTPKEIVGYMCRQSLLAYLTSDTQTGEHGKHEEHEHQPSPSSSSSSVQSAAIEAFLETRDASVLSPDLARELDARLRDVKICDPAIGSGAFPMGLLRLLCALREALVSAPVQPPSGRGVTRSVGGSTPAALKRSVIENNIYGVDIEKGAVDIARLRFWLSLVVDETDPSPLPNLDFKIMQGNSLVESWRGHDLSRLVARKAVGQLTLFEDATDVDRKRLRDLLHKWYDCTDHCERTRLRDAIRAAAENQIRAIWPDFSFDGLDLSANSEFFLWHLWFAEVFDQGGFDIVIGNPPYINVELMSEADKEYYRGHFKCFYKRSDIFALFVETALRQLSNQSGSVIFIIPSAVHANLSYKPLRDLMLDSHWLREVCYTGGDVFREPTVDTTILHCKKPESPSIRLIRAQDFAHPVATEVPAGYFKPFQNLISVESGEKSSIFAKLLSNAKFRPIAADFNVFQGIVTGNNEAFIFETATEAAARGIEKRLLHPLCHGRDIERYAVRSRARRMMYLSGDFDLRSFPNAERWLKPFKPALAKRREALHGVIPWYSLQWPRVKSELDTKEKILVQNTRNESLPVRIAATLDDQSVYATQGINFIIPTTEAVSLRFLLGVLNSKLINFLFQTKFLNLAIKAEYLKQVRLPKEDPRIASLVDHILSAKAADLAADTTFLESQIDALVYRLYGLTDEEIATVEGGK